MRRFAAACKQTFRRRPMSFLTFAEKTKSAKVAVLWDLDNVRPEVYGRRELAEVVNPILDTARSLGDLDDGCALAFANNNTLDWVSRAEKLRRLSIQLDPMRNMVEYDQENHISGFDPSVNALRCGVCGGKFKLFEKLQKHYRTLHERERVKIQNRAKQNRRGTKIRRGVSDKDRHRLKKYSMASVDVNGRDKEKTVMRPLLRELGLRVRKVPKGENEADMALMTAASQFMCEPNAAYIVLVSGDGDFLPMLEEAKLLGVGSLVVSQSKGFNERLLHAADLNLRRDPGESMILSAVTDTGKRMQQMIEEKSNRFYDIRPSIDCIQSTDNEHNIDDVEADASDDDDDDDDDGEEFSEFGPDGRFIPPEKRKISYGLDDG